MKYLKKNTIKALFLFARSSDEPIRHDETLPGVLFDSPAQPSPYHEFLDGLSDGELAELTALYLLGSDKLRSLPEWEAKVLEMMEQVSDDLPQANTQKLPQIIRNGLEKLARFKKQATIAQPSPFMDQETEGRDRLLKIIGQYTQDAYFEKYGELDGLKRLLTLLEVKGYLNDASIRRELGMPALANRLDLEALHIEKKRKP